jgi:acetolactate synthase-1/2/3 large subunit
LRFASRALKPDADALGGWWSTIDVVLAWDWYEGQHSNGDAIKPQYVVETSGT